MMDLAKNVHTAYYTYRAASWLWDIDVHFDILYGYSTAEVVLPMPPAHGHD